MRRGGASSDSFVAGSEAVLLDRVRGEIDQNSVAYLYSALFDAAPKVSFWSATRAVELLFRFGAVTIEERSFFTT